jgi:hypothetical protein
MGNLSASIANISMTWKLLDLLRSWQRRNCISICKGPWFFWILRSGRKCIEDNLSVVQDQKPLPCIASATPDNLRASDSQPGFWVSTTESPVWLCVVLGCRKARQNAQNFFFSLKIAKGEAWTHVGSPEKLIWVIVRHTLRRWACASGISHGITGNEYRCYYRLEIDYECKVSDIIG